MAFFSPMITFCVCTVLLLNPRILDPITESFHYLITLTVFSSFSLPCMTSHLALFSPLLSSLNLLIDSHPPSAARLNFEFLFPPAECFVHMTPTGASSLWGVITKSVFKLGQQYLSRSSRHSVSVTHSRLVSYQYLFLLSPCLSVETIEDISPSSI